MHERPLTHAEDVGGPPSRGRRPAVVAIVGRSGAGKTTFIEALVPELLALGLRVGTVKHDVHGFEMDRPGKDSWRLRRAGASACVVASRRRLAFFAGLDRELSLAEIARRYFSACDIVIAEGYKREAPHRIELFRSGAGHERPLGNCGSTVALVTDTDLPHAHRFSLEDAAGLARFLAARLDELRAY